ncbi:aldehyde dehydrogenase family protein, partial [Stenotrophomonas sp. GbtcB23]|uniref:aldehyde dehydrogenase family protein n=1 Tax=Stenotrophomonas sp. GbtcB23 TaxID=2824768 RepID=UPI0031F2FF1B
MWDRAALCRRIADSVRTHREELARVVTIDQGKPLAEANAEIGKAIEGFENAGEMIKWLEGRVIPSADPHKIVTSRYVAKGIQAV